MVSICLLYCVFGAVVGIGQCISFFSRNRILYSTYLPEMDMKCVYFSFTNNRLCLSKQFIADYTRRGPC